MALIVNADDFGMNDKVNSAITDAFDRGLIDRTTLLVNMPCAKKAMDVAKDKEFLERIGLHLNLTSGRPLTDEMAQDPVMCNSAGEFTAEFARNMKTRFFLPKKTRENVERELRAQLDMFGTLGGKLWHVDSHHHVHTDPSVWRILKKVLRDYPIVSVRLGRNMYKGGNPLFHIYKSLLNSSIRKFCIGHPALFGSAEDYKEYAEEKPDLSERFDVEVMVHPAYDSKGTLSDAYMGEFHELLRLY